MTMRASGVLRRQQRPYYNLASKSEHGRRMTGFMTPYRHFMWKQNELWRNVHEAQFEHLRRTYKRQWLEAFRLNSDEYIAKYNVTKAAQLAQWEGEMHSQEKKRVEELQKAQGRKALQSKHLDLLREYHERQFFYWYERASERLQYMTHIPYIPQSQLQEHIEKELNKYVAGNSGSPYPLNFAGQMPLLEDADGSIAEVPSGLMVNHTAENPASTAVPYSAPQGEAMADEQLLQMLAGAQEEALVVPGADSAAFSEAINDVIRGEDSQDEDVKVARSVEESEDDREVSRRAYIDRGKTGSRAIFRPRDDGTAPAASPSSAPRLRKRKKKDEAQARIEELGRELQKNLVGGAAATDAALPGIGEVGAAAGRLRDRVVLPTIEEIKQSTDSSHVRMQNILDKRYGRGKFKPHAGETPKGEDL